MKRFLLLALVIVTVLYSNFPGTEAPISETRPQVASVSEAVLNATSSRKSLVTPTVPLHTVVKVIDGDTVILDIGGSRETVRLIGINTPETVDPRKGVECFGREASAEARKQLDGRRVKIESDPSQDARDKYGRLLLYVTREDGLSFNEYMIRAGYAYEYTYKIPYTYQMEFKKAEAEARVLKKGLWSDGLCAKEIQMDVPVPVASGFVCSVNTYGCRDFKTQSEAQSVFEACGGSDNDIHRLDSDGDGIVCESVK